MRENPPKITTMETLSINGFRTPYNDITHRNNDGKPIMFSISSNVYYGYQPLTTVQNTIEPMCVEDLSKSCVEMDTTQSENPFINRKRTRNDPEITLQGCKKRRQSESPKLNSPLQRCLTAKVVLDEDLLRETHGCSYYHWVASNI